MNDIIFPLIISPFTNYLEVFDIIAKFVNDALKTVEQELLSK